MKAYLNGSVRRAKSALWVSLLCLSASSASGINVYWDLNGNAPGASLAPNGFWDTSANWNADPAGEGLGTLPWAAGDTAIFSAGTDAVGPYTVTIDSPQSAAGVIIEEGAVTFTGSVIPAQGVNIGTGTFTILSGASLSINTAARIAGAAGGKVVLNGGTLIQTNPTNALAFIPSALNLEIGPNGGTVSFNSDTAAVSIIGATNFSTTIVGTGTMTKTGPDELRYQGTGLPNTTYTKLVVREGLFRLGFNSNTQDERGFGAVPDVFLPDAITLDGGSIGTSFNVTLHVNRGVTLGPAGGSFTTAAGAMTIPGAVTGGGALNKLTTGTLTLNGNNDYTGVTTVNAGILTVGSASALGSISGNTAVGSGGEVRVTGAASNFTVNEPIQIAGIGGAGGGALAILNSATPTFAGIVTLVADAAIAASSSANPTFSAPIFATGNHTLTLQGDSTAGALISGPIGTGGGALVKSGTGRWRLSGPNAYTGPTTINAGTLQFMTRDSLYGGVPALWTPASIIVNTGGTLALNVGGPGEFTVGDLDVLTTLGTATGGFMDGSTLALDTTNAAGGTFTYPTPIANPNGGAHALGLTKIGTGTLILNGANTYTGPTTVLAGMLAEGPAGSIADTSNLIVNGATARFELGTNHNDTVGTVTLQGGGSITGSGNSALTSTGSFELQNGTVSAILAGNVPLNKTTAGTVTLSGANTYSGITTISDGTLSVASLFGASSLGTGTSPIVLGSATTTGALVAGGNGATFTRGFDVKLGGGRIEFASGGQTLTIATGSIQSLDGGLLTLDGLGDFVISADVALGNGGLTKSGAGTLRLSGSTNFAGVTSLLSGTTILTGGLSATSAVNILGTLAGNGEIAPGLDGSVLLLANGKLSPGNPVGTLTVTLSGAGSLNLTTGINNTLSTPPALLFDLDTPLTSDKVTVTGGALTIGAGLLEFDDFGFTLLPGFDNSDYVLFDGNVPISGTLGANLTGTLAGRSATLQLADNGNDLVLHVIPEPTSTAILLLGTFALLTPRRRRH